MSEIVSLPQRGPRPLFAWLLPLVYAAGCALGAAWPGWNGQMFGLGALPGVWAGLLLGGAATPDAWLWPTIAAGAPMLGLLGHLLDRLGADLMVWGFALLVASGAAGYLLLQGHADLDAAVARHGSLLAIAVCALQLGSYGATLVALIAGAGPRQGGRS